MSRGHLYFLLPSVIERSAALFSGLPSLGLVAPIGPNYAERVAAVLLNIMAVVEH
jgi:hypothetical protein